MGPEGDSWIWYNYFPEACSPQGPRAGMLSCRSGSSSPGSPSAPTDPSPHESAAAPCRATLPPLPIPQAPLPCAKPGKMRPWPPADQRPAPSTQHKRPSHDRKAPRAATLPRGWRCRQVSSVLEGGNASGAPTPTGRGGRGQAATAAP